MMYPGRFAGILHGANLLFSRFSRRAWIVAPGLFLFALSCRLLYLHQIALQSPFFDMPVADAEAFFRQAEQLATEFHLGDGPFRQPPLYPAFLGALYLLLGPEFFAFRLVQFALGAVSVVLLYLIGRRVFSPGIALAAGAVAAVCGPLIYFEGELLPPVLAVFLSLSLLLFLLREDTLEKLWSCLAAGLLLGLAGLAMPGVLLFGPGVAGWILRRADLGGLSARFGRVALFALGTLLVVGSVALRNYHKGDDLVMLSSNSGLDFYIGNNPDYPNSLAIRPGTAWNDLIQRPESAGLEKPSEQSAWFWRAALSFAAEQPMAYMGLLAAKAGHFWQGGEIRHKTDLYFARTWSALLSGLVWHRYIAFPFGLIAPLGIVGLLLAIRERQAGLLIVFVLCYALAVVAFFPTSRSRLPAVPLLILLACHAGSWLKTRILERDWRGTALVAGLLLLLGWQLNAGAVTMADEAQDRYYVALASARKGMTARATLELHETLKLDPRHYDARLKLAELYTELGYIAQAEGQYRLLVAQAPRKAAPRLNLAHLYLAEGRMEEALSLFEEVVVLEPEAARSYVGLAGALRAGGRLHEAEAAYRRALELEPQHFDARHNLAFVYEQVGRAQEAEREYRKLLRRWPEHADVRNNLGVVHLQRGDFSAAASEFLHVLEGDSTHVRARRNLVSAYEGMGRYHEAVGQCEILIETGEEDAQVYSHLVRLYRKLGDADGVWNAMEKQRTLQRQEEIREILQSRVDQLRGAASY